MGLVEMREIKFKAWYKAKKDFIRLEIDTILNLANGDKTVKLDTYNNQVVFLQYTGLKDRDGVEIYEGDILYVFDKESDLNEKNIVIFEKGGFMLKDCNEAHVFEILDICEVIGNIHENPELLEQK